MSRAVDDYPTFDSLCCVAWCSAETSIAETWKLLEPRLANLAAHETSELIVNLADGPKPPIDRRREDGSKVAATVTLRLLDGQDPRSSAAQLGAALRPACSFLAIYRQQVALPRAYERSWPDGQPSPGLKQISLIRRKPGMTLEAFLRHWHLTHTPLALEVHPLWSYVRGVVCEALTPDAPDYDGIVELHFRHVEDVTDMQRFYGGDSANMARIASDVQSFIDLSRIELVHATERVLRSSYAHGKSGVTQ